MATILFRDTVGGGLTLAPLGEEAQPYTTRTLPEGANQTFIAGSPVVLTGGFVVQAANPVTTIYGIALGPGQNNPVAGAVETQIVPMTPRPRRFHASLTRAGGLEHNWLATDLGDEVGLYLFASAVWIADVAGTGFRVVDGVADRHPAAYKNDDTIPANRLASNPRADLRIRVGDAYPRPQLIPNADILQTAS